MRVARQAEIPPGRGVSGITAGAANFSRGAEARPTPGQRAADIARNVRPPTFPDRVFDITKFGAIAGWRHPQHERHRQGDRCLRECRRRTRAGAAPARFLTGAIHLKSNVELHVSDGATLLFDTNPSSYPIVFTRWEGMELHELLAADLRVRAEEHRDHRQRHARWPGQRAELVAVERPMGRHGRLRLEGRHARPAFRPAKRLFDMAEAGVPVEKRVFGDGSLLRPPFIQPYDCENVLIEGVRVRNSPFWNIHPVLCRNVTLRGVDVFGHGPNNDGVDPESVDHMLIEDCSFDTGDDCIAVNSGRNADGRRLATPSQNILMRNCRMQEGHGGVVVGSQISGGARWVFAENCHMDSPNLWYAIRFKNNALRGGLLENFYYRDIDVGQVGRAAITCDFNYEEGANGPFIPQLRNVVVERLRVKNAIRVLDSQGLPQAPVE